VAEYHGLFDDEVSNAPIDPEVDLSGSVSECVVGGEGVEGVGRKKYVAAAYSCPAGLHEHVIGRFELRHWAVFILNISRGVENEGGILC
jgi:hypothetical protein